MKRFLFLLITLSLTFVGMPLPVLYAQTTTFTVTCSGTNDTASFSSLISTIGANVGTIYVPYKSSSSARCAVNTLTVPSNITLDNSKGSGIKTNNGQTLTTGPIVNPKGRQMFYNVGAGLGTVLMTNAKQDVIDVSWFGPANAVDSTDPFTAALTIAAASTAPSSTLALSAGKWVIGAPIVKNLTNLQSQLTIKGEGSATQLVLGVSNAEAAITIQNGHKVVFRDMVVVGNGAITGSNAAQWTLWRGLAFSGTLQALVENVDFYGIQSNVTPDGGAVHANNTHLTLRDVAFRSCGGSSVLASGMATVTNWNELTAENIHILDFGVLNGIYYTSPSVSEGWMRLGNVAVSTINAYSGGYATFKNIVTDEGTNHQLYARTTDGSVIQSIVIDNWRANNSLDIEFYFDGVKRVLIKNSKVAYASSTAAENLHAVVYATNVDAIEIENTDFLLKQNRISLGPSVGFLRVKDTTFQRLDNPNCTLVEVIKRGERLPITPCNAISKQAPSGALREYFNQDDGRQYVSFDGHDPVALHGGKAPSPLYDSFTETALATAKWDSTSSANITPTQVNNRLQFTVANSAGADATPGRYVSDNTYDFSKNGIVSVYLPTLPTTASSGEVAQNLIVTAADGTTPIYTMNLHTGNNGQIIMTDDAGSSSNALPYGAYWRIRYTAGSPSTVKFEVSTNNSVWAEIRSSTTTAAVTAVKFRLEAWAINTPATVTIHPTFDDFRFSQHFPSLISDDGVALNLTSPIIGGGTAISRVISGSSVVSYTALAANSCEVQTIGLTGAAPGDTVTLGLPNGLADVDGAVESTTFFAWVSAVDTVSIRRCNPTGTVTANPGSAIVRVTVTKF